MKQFVFISAVLLSVAIGVYGNWRNRIRNWNYLEKCDEHFRTTSDNYVYFELDDLPGTRPPGYRVKFPFYVVAEKNAHIVFSQNSGGTIWNGPAYEIMIHHVDGANTWSYLRRGGNYPTELKKESTPYVTSASKPADVVVAVTNDGHLTLTVDGKLLAAAMDNEPFPINYVAFKSWQAVDISYYFNCTRPETGGMTVTNFYNNTYAPKIN